jgi:ligand-binding sensor domain-containing protein
MNQTYRLLLLSAFVVSCHGQGNIQLPTTCASGLAKIAASQPEISKPQCTAPSTSTRCGWQDKAGSLWFCTAGAGVYRYSGTQFTHFTSKDGLSNNVVYCMLEDNAGNTWFGTNDGVCRYDGSSFSRFRIPGIDNDNYYFSTSTFGTKRPNAKPVFSMIQDKKGNLWFGTERMGLYRYDGISFTNFTYNDSTAAFRESKLHGKWQMAPNDSIKLNNGNHRNDIQCLLEDKAGNIWFSATAHGGVYRYDGKNFTHFLPEERVKSPVSYMLEDKTGNIWFGTTNDGVYRYDGQSFTYFTEKEGLGSNNTTCIFEDKTGNIWFAGSFPGEPGKKRGCVTRYNGKNFTPFPMKGLRNGSIWNMLEDNAGNIWFGARNAGLYRYDGQTFTDFSDEGAIVELQEVPDGC